MDTSFLHPEVPWLQFVIRGVAVYAFLLVVLRVAGRRELAQVTNFDLVLLLVLSNAVQNSMSAGDNSVTGGLLLATTLVALNWGVSYGTWRSKRIAAWVEGRPEILIHNGHLFEDVMTRSKLTHHELMAALRDGGCNCVEDVHSAILENNGSISVTQRKRSEAEIA